MGIWCYCIALLVHSWLSFNTRTVHAGLVCVKRTWIFYFKYLISLRIRCCRLITPELRTPWLSSMHYVCRLCAYYCFLSFVSLILDAPGRALYRPQITLLHQALSWTALSIFLQLYLKPVASISFSQSLPWSSYSSLSIMCLFQCLHGSVLVSSSQRVQACSISFFLLHAINFRCIFSLQQEVPATFMFWLVMLSSTGVGPDGFIWSDAVCQQRRHDQCGRQSADHSGSACSVSRTCSVNRFWVRQLDVH